MNDDHNGHMPTPNTPASPGVTGPDAAAPGTDPTQWAQPTTTQPQPQGTPDLSSVYAPNSYEPSPVTPNQTPQKKNRGLLVGAGVAVLALLVVLGGVFALRGNSGVGASTFSLQSAAKSASAAKSVAYEMTISAQGQPIKVVGQIDSAADMMSMNMDLMGQGEIEAIIDAKSQKMYMSSEVFASATSTKWISIDTSVVPGMEQQLAGGFGGNPLQVTGLFDGSQKTTEIGKETINGVETMHYEVIMDKDEIMAKAPDAFAQLDSNVRAALPDEIAYQFYVTENNELARMSFDMNAAGMPTSVVMDLKAIDQTDPITIPAESDVTDMTDMMAGAMGAMDSATG